MNVPASRPSREAWTEGSPAIAWAGLATAVAGPLLALAPIPGSVAFIALLLFACVAPGAACVCHVRLGDPVAAWTIVLMLSMSLSILSATTLAWTRWWHPDAGLMIVGVLCAVSCVLALVRPRQYAPASPGAAAAITPGEPTAMTPRVTGGDLASDGKTAVIPRVSDTDSAMNQTAVIPRLTDSAMDQTAVIPRLTDSAMDQTAVIPRLSGGEQRPATDTTSVKSAANPVRHRSAPRWQDFATPVLTLLAGLASWAWSIGAARMDAVDDYGLLSAMHPAFVAAIMVCVLGFMIEVSRTRPRPWSAVGHTVLLLLIMHATVPLLVAEPEYAWTYKHLGIIDLIASGHTLDNPYDVYQQWPAFFALVAQLTVAAGIPALEVASWAPVFFGLVNLMPVYAITRTLSTNRRAQYIVAFVYSAINWVGQDYLAPQAFAFTLSLGAILIMLRWLRLDPLASRGRRRLAGRLWAWVQVGMGSVPYTSRRTRKTSLATLYLVYAAIVVSHQLSPYLVAIGAAVLIAFRLVQPVQILPIFGVIAVLQLLPRYRLVEAWGLFDGFNLFANAKPIGSSLSEVSAGRSFSVLVVQILALTVWLTAAIVVVANRRRLGPLAVPAALAAGPFAILLGNSYGGEAVFRVFLFSSPWCAYLITIGLLRLRLRRALGVGLAAPLLMVAGLVSIQGEHGQLMVNSFTSNEVRAAQYLYTNVPADSAIVMAGANFPDRINAGYTGVLGRVGADATVLPDAASEGAVPLGEALNQDDLDALNSYFNEYAVPVFLVFSRSQAKAAEYFGYYPPDRLRRLRTLVDESSSWQLWYGNDDTRIYRYSPALAAP